VGWAEACLGGGFSKLASVGLMRPVMFKQSAAHRCLRGAAQSRGFAEFRVARVSVKIRLPAFFVPWTRAANHEARLCLPSRFVSSRAPTLIVCGVRCFVVQHDCSSVGANCDAPGGGMLNAPN
jgi:hypothetical protein